MSRFSGAALVALVFLVFTAGAADARRGFRVPIVIPGIGGGGESLERVLDLPDIPALLREDGRYIDLGYLHRRSGEGEWIGHIGSSSEFVKLSERQLKQLLMIAGVPELPPVPERKSGGAALMWLIVAALVLGGGFKLLRRLTSGAARAGRRVAQVTAKGSESDWSKAHDEIARAAERKAMLARLQQSGAGSGAAAPRVPTAPVTAMRGLAPAARVAGGGFGRRGR